MKISRITCYEVLVPAREGAIDSKQVSKPLHKLPVGAMEGWSLQFDQLPKLLIKMELESGIVGWGELYRNHNWATVDAIIHTLLGRDIESLSLQHLPFTFCREYDGFECAVWDAYARLHNMRVVDLLGGPCKQKVKVSAWSSHRVIEEVEDLVKNYHALGYDCIKFKCDLQDDVQGWCETIATTVPSMQVILDPNERWQYAFEARKRIDGLKNIGNVLCIEDPVPRWKLTEYASLRAYSSIPVVLHVSLPYLLDGQRIKDAIQAIQLEAVDGFNFNGGLADFQRLDHIASASGLPCWHGSEIDLGILEAMYVHCSSAAASCTWPSDIFGRLIRTHDLLKTPLLFEPPYVYLPQGNGLGVEPDPDAIAYYQTAKKEYHL
ncbi:mandelate racemase/muconate lactonizing enzyme family protein [Agriterribacter sp.]|uniref:mandelate racemase/muconate lactonizing enzyme family protein n=1 Tax=Agriterribacter sp. TaxID=2821509 RepID=UPI002B9A2179|nr:mandelate racemase/muconate lactonizing enzyme family protein [Agriterribacter sp.]HRO47953.1 mandelate racemase/muconate lactonizing enzyme family protein [Agriterribacter sp.]HRQ18634.1 mandelate racemase/muconate lactonizing enzyme family protein [Agriterribacter sp.]